VIKREGREIGHQIEREGKNESQTSFKWKKELKIKGKEANNPEEKAISF
jgi:hypothetical protein